MNLNSSVKDKGETVTQYILFKNGNEKTYKGIITDSIQQSQFTRFDLVSGARVYVNTDNVDVFEVHQESDSSWKKRLMELVEE